jgi:sensor c-di-GMP phosphodiesterase-like protein
VQLGKTLHIETLAEGIEDQVQLETLQREHCDHGQGFLFSRPLDTEAVEAFLQTGAAAPQAAAPHAATAAPQGGALTSVWMPDER